MTAVAEFIEHSQIWNFIISFLFEGFDITGGILLSFIILRERPKRKIYPYIIMSVVCAIYALSRVYSFNFKNDIGYIAASLAPLIVFPISKKNSYKYCLLSFGYDLVCGIFASVFAALMGNSYDSLTDSIQFVYSSVVVLIFGILTIIIANIAGRKNDSEALLAKIKLPLLGLIIITITVFVCTMIHYQIDSGSKPRDFYLSLLNIVLFAVTITYSVRSFLKSRIAEESYKNQLTLQIQHFELLEKKNEELRVFRHDMPKKLRPLSIYLDRHNYDEAKNIVDEFNVTIENSRPRYDTGNYRLDTVLESQQQLAEKYGIQIEYVHASVFPKEGIAPEDIYTIFPNALDNALEACIKTGEKCKITFESHIIENKVYIKICNPYSGLIYQSNGKLSTTKADKVNHGYGFKSMKKAASKYGSDNVNFKTEDGLFALMITLNLS